MKYLVVATEAELELPWAKVERERVPIITGVGGTNVIRALRDIPRDSDILNVGYCGSNMFPVGTVIWPQHTRLFHPNIQFEEETFALGCSSSGVICLTSGDFVTTGIGVPQLSVIDMELAYIAAFGFNEIAAVKYVSDNFNIKEYERCLRK